MLRTESYAIRGALSVRALLTQAPQARNVAVLGLEAPIWADFGARDHTRRMLPTPDP